MFKQMAEMLEPGSSLVLTVAKEKDGKLCVQVRPVGEFKNVDLGRGITFTEEAETIDAEFAEAMASYGSAHKSLKEQVEDRVRVMAAAEEAEKAAKGDAVKKAAAKGGAKPAAVATPQKKQQAAAAAATERGGDQDEADAEADGEVGVSPGGELTLF